MTIFNIDTYNDLCYDNLLMDKCLLIQPGAFGDIFICAPIAYWYHNKGYSVHWPVTEKFLSTLAYFPYVKPLEIENKPLHPDWLRSDVMKIIPSIPDYELVVNLADRGPHPTAQTPWENFEECKYRIGGVPFAEKNNLRWERNEEKEEKLFTLLGVSKEEDYAIVHKRDSSGQDAIVPDIKLKTIEVSPIAGFNIPDWFAVFSRAKQIFCVESSIHQFMDGIINSLTTERFLLRRPAISTNNRFTVSAHWNLKYMGENSIIKG